tara:strand:+ start:944 stop:1633 length:690 start_codon:yes stop_codon:yes gene_type:complete
MKKIFIACDTDKISVAKKIISCTKSKKLSVGYKFGMQFFYSKSGREFLSKLDKKKLIWLDLKLKDIPNTVGSSIMALKDLKNVRYLTVHCSGGLDMLKRSKLVARKINNKLKIIGVTVLTSLKEKSLKEIGYSKKIRNITTSHAKLAKKAKLDGIVCSGHEIKKIKKICKNMEIIIPGIRLPGDKKQDQQRVMTPKLAFKSGASAIVIGRSITKGNIKNNIKRLLYSLN